jgi:uncharacterized coiled-coil protein SlyX
MSERKVVGRNVAIVLGIICIILVVGLIGAVTNYTSIIKGKDDTIASLNSQITEKDNTISSLNLQIATRDSQISSLNSQIASLQNQVSDLNSIINLEKSTVWVDDQTVSQPANSYTYWTFSASYAGYISVMVHTSTTTNTYVQLIWSTPGIYYDHTITVGAGGEAAFPILPSSSIEIRVGNTNWVNGATETVTIIYYY